MTRADHIANGPHVATVRRFLESRERLSFGDENLAEAGGAELTAHALRTLLAEHDAYRDEATAEPATDTRRTPGNQPPAWAYDLLIAVLNYEDAHGSHRDGWTCFGVLIDETVPSEEIEKARTIDAYWRQKEPS